jgi:hypothetical protein
LTILPALNDNLKTLYCYNNQLITLPNLNDNLTIISFCNNPVCERMGSISFDNKQKINKWINKWNNFREFYFLSKLKKKLISWMWKSREKQIRQLFHPSHLIQFLENNHVSDDDNSSLDIFLNHWN